jgi:hypothetical protein
MMDIKNYYTAIQFANKKRVTKEAVYMAIYRGDLDAIKIGRQWFILKTAKYSFQKRTYEPKTPIENQLVKNNKC